jgi:urease accessory protein
MIAGALTALVPEVAFAHVFGGDGGPGAGFMHPLTGADRLLAMYVVGVLSTQIGGRAIWMVPSAFVAAMIVGGILGTAAIALPGAELGVALSVVALGAAVAGGGRARVWVALAAAGGFGLFHGYAHGAEMPAAASPLLYALGFTVSTAGLHVLGALTGLLVLCRARGPVRLRGAGILIALVGVYFVVAALRQPPTVTRALANRAAAGSASTR